MTVQFAPFRAGVLPRFANEFPDVPFQPFVYTELQSLRKNAGRNSKIDKYRARVWTHQPRPPGSTTRRVRAACYADNWHTSHGGLIGRLCQLKRTRIYLCEISKAAVKFYRSGPLRARYGGVSPQCAVTVKARPSRSTPSVMSVVVPREQLGKRGPSASCFSQHCDVCL